MHNLHILALQPRTTLCYEKRAPCVAMCCLWRTQLAFLLEASALQHIQTQAATDRIAATQNSNEAFFIPHQACKVMRGGRSEVTKVK